MFYSRTNFFFGFQMMNLCINKSLVYQNNWMSESAQFIVGGIRHQLGSDLLSYQNRSKKVLPNCASPPQSGESTEIYHTEDMKKDAVLKDPKFGMFSLYKYHVTRGYHNDALKDKNMMFCSHIFSLYAALPILIVIAQWVLLISLVVSEWENYELGVCPQRAPLAEKLTMAGISIMYFTRSFFLWDNMVDRSRLYKMVPVIDIWVILDTFMEFSYALMVNIANLWLVFIDTSVSNMLMNSLAMEFLMQMDNEYEELYFEFLPESAADIFDHVFVTHRENRKLVQQKVESSVCFRFLRCMSWIPFKLLTISMALFPVVCLAFVFIGAYCK